MPSKIKKILYQAAQMGIDLNVRENLRSVLTTLSIDAKKIDTLWVKIVNEVHQKEFSKIGAKDRVILLPHCLRQSETCEAKTTKLGLDCQMCNPNCAIYQIRELAENLGYHAVFVSPGGSMALNIVSQIRPKALVAVACQRELYEALSIAKEKHLDKKIFFQVVPLTKDGCIDTIMDQAVLLQILQQGLEGVKPPEVELTERIS